MIKCRSPIFEKNPGSPIFWLRGNDTGWLANTLPVTAPGDFAVSTTCLLLSVQFHSVAENRAAV